MWRVVWVLAVLSAVGGALYSYNGALREAEASRAEAQREALRAASWKAAHDSLIDERGLWDELLMDNARAVEQVDARRRQAEGRYQQALRDLAEARRWAAAAVPVAVAAGLCLQAGSCAGGDGREYSGAPAGAGAGTATAVGAGWRLTNDALRDGLENCRAALGRANGKIDAIRQWSERR